MPEARFQEAVKKIASADAVNKQRRAQTAVSLVPRLLRDGGPDAVYQNAIPFEDAGGFTETPWANPAYLRPRLWAGSFDASAPYPWMECLSTLRLLAVAKGEAKNPDVDATQARRFLEKVMALNLDKIIDAGSEASRTRRVKHHDEAGQILRFVLAQLPANDFLKDVAHEIHAIMAQRPVWTHHVRQTLRLVSMSAGAQAADVPLLDRYVEAVLGPTPMSMRFRDAESYAQAISKRGIDLDTEIEQHAASLRRTGLACRQSAVLLRKIAHDPERLRRALGLNNRGTQVLEEHRDLVAELVHQTITPDTAQTAYGLARFLERGLLERSEVAAALQQILHVELTPELDDLLRGSADGSRELTGAQILVGGLIRVLGQPLGIGQGNNPTCQAARGISLWSQYRPGHLIDTLTQAARDGDIAMMFEGQTLHSSQLSGGLAPHLDLDLDPVSLVLVPHLDRLYDEMMRRAAGRADDGHKWVNPALYGRTVPPGFTSCFDPITWQVVGFDAFIRRFITTFHPGFHQGKAPVYATPVGITVTDNRARLLGLHAVTLQRVDKDADGVWRVYFYNPNNEGRQDWGQGVAPTVQGHGEKEGESSLPFAHFAARTYAYHHPIRIIEGAADVPQDLVDEITSLARQSWGRAYTWDGLPVEDHPPVR